jgi:Protein of unknown function (DUF3168)
MSIGELLFAALSADGGVSSIAEERIYPNVLVQGSQLPAVVYTVISDIPSNSMNGVAGDRRFNSRVQVDCYGRKYLDAQGLADAVDACIVGLVSPDFNAWLDLRRDLYDNGTQYHRVSMDFFTWR